MFDMNTIKRNIRNNYVKYGRGRRKDELTFVIVDRKRDIGIEYTSHEVVYAVWDHAFDVKLYKIHDYDMTKFENSIDFTAFDKFRIA